MTQETARMLQPDAVFGDRYRIVRCIRTGGMGAVYEAAHLETGRRVALKVMLPSLVVEPTLRARFKLEATVAASVESEHIVDVLDAGVETTSGAPFLVMELLRGDDVSTLLKREGPFAPEEAVHLLWQASLALDKTHASGIVHRDLKPDNLFLTRRDDGTARLKILDFGIAKVMAESPVAGQQTATVGTPLYMAPEQINGDSIAPACDLYSLGHIAYALLVGRSYWFDEWQGGPIYPLLLKVLKGAVEPASVRAARHGGALPPAFDPWFAKATATAPNDRFASAHEQVRALAEALTVSLPSPRRERRTLTSSPDIAGPPRTREATPQGERLPVPPPRAPLASGFVAPATPPSGAGLAGGHTMPTPVSSPDLSRMASRPSFDGAIAGGAMPHAHAVADGVRQASQPSFPSVNPLGGTTPHGLDGWKAPLVPTPPSGVGFNVATAPRPAASDPGQESLPRRRGVMQLVVVAVAFAAIVCGGVVFLSWPADTPGSRNAASSNRTVSTSEAAGPQVDPVSLEGVRSTASDASTVDPAPSAVESASSSAPPSSPSDRPAFGSKRLKAPDPVGTSFY